MWFLLWVLALAYGAVSDIRRKKIPDSCTGILCVCGLASFGLFPETGGGERILGFFIVSVPMLLLALFFPGSFGGGDIKLMAVSGLALGWQRALCAAGTGIVLAAGYCVWLLAVKRKGRKTEFALGPFLCLGILTAALAGDRIFAWLTG